MTSVFHRFYGFKHTIIWETLSLGEKILSFSRGTFRNSLEFKRTILILSEKPLSLNSFLELSENRWKKPGWTVTYRKQADLKIPPCTKKVSKTMRYGILIITANTTKIIPPRPVKTHTDSEWRQEYSVRLVASWSWPSPSQSLETTLLNFIASKPSWTGGSKGTSFWKGGQKKRGHWQVGSKMETVSPAKLLFHILKP